MTFTNWTLIRETMDEQRYMSPLFTFVLKQFMEIFEIEALNSEQCIVYNEPTAPCPMLVTNRAPIRIRTNSASLNYWAQYIYQLSHELTHYVIRQYKEDKDAIVKWFEETICEAMSLYILKMSSLRWNECPLSRNDPNYSLKIMHYFENVYNKIAPSALKKCHTLDDLKAVEDFCETRRDDRGIERNYLLNNFLKYPESISAFIYYPLYMRGDLQIDFAKWTKVSPSPIVSALESIQPNLAS